MNLTRLFLHPLILFSIFSCKSSEQLGRDQVKVANDFALSIATTGCMGTCEVYTLDINAEGKVRFEGKAYTKMEGLYTNKVEEQQLEDILYQADSLGFRTWEESYDMEEMMDLPSVKLSIRNGKESHQVYARIGAPDDFYLLIERIRAIVIRNPYKEVKL